jgi:stage II sporulation protein D
LIIRGQKGDDWLGKWTDYWKGLTKGQRMQTKALAGIMGVILLVILAVAWLLLYIGERERQGGEIVLPLPPVITYLKNVWIMEASTDSLLVYQDGAEKTYPIAQNDANTLTLTNLREQVADITLTDGAVTQVHTKTQKVGGKVLGVDESGVELEGIGRILFGEDMKGYRLYGSIAMSVPGELIIGYNFQDFVLENGKICAFLVVREEAMDNIRVLLKSANYNSMFHDSLTFTADTEYVITYGAPGDLMEEIHQAGDICTIDTGSTYFQGERVTIAQTALTGKMILKSVTRSSGEPDYRGKIEVLQVPDGLAVINEVPLEEYLYAVIPSEMPASYPAEALKAQAICARTYAYGHMQDAGYPQYGAHVDDSTNFQVYNNGTEHESTTTAAKETYGQLLFTDSGELAETFYYSTSCGIGSDTSVWKSANPQPLTYIKPRTLNHATMERILSAKEDGGEQILAVMADIDMAGESMRTEENFRKFIQTKNDDDFECTESWYRWTYTVSDLDEDRLLEALQSRYQASPDRILTMVDGTFVSQPIEELGRVMDIRISNRVSGGNAEELLLETDKHTFKILTGHNIRYVLNDGETKVHRQDGSQAASPNLLPSAFFLVDTVKEKDYVTGYTLTGGGFGHGVGMSQNGAKNMSLSGYSAKDILEFFYENCTVSQIYSEAQG